jgi:GMP synthase-like glutamine amidotransferase
MKSPRAIAIVHSDTDVPGSLPELFGEQGLDLEIVSISQALPAPEALDIVVVMGSPESAYDHRLSWLDAELKWLKSVQARRADAWICFGSQLLARALGVRSIETPRQNRLD